MQTDENLNSAFHKWSLGIILDVEEERKKDLKILDALFEKAKESSEYADLLKLMFPLAAAVKDSDIAKRFLRERIPPLIEKFDKNRARMALFEGYSKAKGKDPVIILGKLFVYLGIFETSLTDLINMILMILMSIGHDFYVERTHEYAQTLKDLDRASLHEKLVFLDSHGFQTISKNLNTRLRNKIAHMDFVIELDGKISAAGGKFDIEDESIKITFVIAIIIGVMQSSGFVEILRELRQ